MIHRYPYTDFNEYNLDWCIERVKELTSDWLETQEEWTGTKAEWTALYNYVHDYFDNLDVSQEVGQIIDDYRRDGTLATICQPIVDHWVEDNVPDQIESWLDSHVTQETGYVLDSSLTLANAAAPAKTVGDALTDVNNALDDLKEDLQNGSYGIEWEQGTWAWSQKDSRTTAISSKKLYHFSTSKQIIVKTDSDDYKTLLTWYNDEQATTRQGSAVVNGLYTLNPTYYYGISMEKSDSTDITPSDSSHAIVYIPFEVGAIAESRREYLICGYDAPLNMKAYANYVCSSSSELDSGINDFIDTHIDEWCTFKFYGTIRASHGIHKHPKHNLDGYNCTIIMGDSLGDDYWMCIQPTNGGVPFSSQQVINHNLTYVKGFRLDGNYQGNTTNNTYSYKSVYGGVICGEIYNQDVSPYSQTQLCSDIILEDITAYNTFRGVIIGIGWRVRNILVRDAVNDHGVYFAGAEGAYAENIYITGTHKNGALCVSPQSWDVNRRVGNIRIKNVTMFECASEVHLEIRGHFSSDGNNQTLDNVTIDNLEIKNNSGVGATLIRIGTDASNANDAPLDPRNYPIGVKITNLSVIGRFWGTIMHITNANVICRDAWFYLSSYRPTRATFMLQGVNVMKKALDFSRTRISYGTPTSDDVIDVFSLDNTYDSNHNQINGLDISDLIIEGSTDYYLFGTANTESPKVVTLSDLASERVIASPVEVINPNSAEYIDIVNQSYITLT